jgi:hypothetical protein
MAASIGSMVHPWYKGKHLWKVKDIAQLDQPVKYQDDEQGEVCYDPKIMLLEVKEGCTALWFNYWISTDKANHKMRYGGGPPILEESVLLELLKKAIKNGQFSQDFLTALDKEIKLKIKQDTI